MADGFIRPPVSVIIHLPCTVALRKLSWLSKVGEHTSLLHKVYATSTSLPCSLECPKASGGQTRLANWTRIGISTAREGLVRFVNRKLVNEALDDSHEKLGSSEDRFLLEKVNALRLEVCTTLAASLPCLSNLRIEGSPAQGKKNQQKAEQLVMKQKNQSFAQSSAPAFSFFGGGNEEHPELHNIEDQDLDQGSTLDSPTPCPLNSPPPSDFLDSITEEVMEIPMTLPSGHTVDRSTLDKCTDHFASWGGPPRDPYTGKLFHKGSEPVFNPGLKARIDRWRTGSGTMGKGRTLGNAEQISRFLEAKSDNTSMKRKFTESVAHGGSSKVFKVGDGKRN